MRRLLTGVTVAVSLIGANVGTVAAQEASPAASPMAATCEASEFPPGPPTPMEQMVPEGTPVEAMVGMELDTPEAVEEVEAIAEIAELATPELAAGQDGEVADEATAERVISAAENLIACPELR